MNCFLFAVYALILASCLLSKIVVYNIIICVCVSRLLYNNYSNEALLGTVVS